MTDSKAREHRPLAERFSEIPVNRFLGYELLAHGDGQARLSMPLRPEYAQEAGVVQGGIVTALADTAAAYAFSVAGNLAPMTGVTLSMQFLRPAELHGPQLEAEAQLVRRGRRVSVCDVKVSQGTKLVATGTFTFLHL